MMPTLWSTDLKGLGPAHDGRFGLASILHILHDHIGPSTWALNAVSDAAGTLGTDTSQAMLCTNATLAALAEDKALRPLDDYLTAEGIQIPDHQRIVIKGKTLAIAVLADAQVLAYRPNVFAQAGVEVPKTLLDISAAVDAIAAETDVKTPFLLDTADGWGLAQTLLSHMASPLDDASGAPMFATQDTQDLLHLLRDLATSSDTAFERWQAGDGAMMLTSGSQMARLNNAADVAAQPLSQPGSDAPATPIWWQGWAIPADQSDEDAQAAFDAMAQTSDPDFLTPDLMEQTLWLMDSFRPSAIHEGVLKAVAAGAEPVPVERRNGLLHAAFAHVLPAFMQGGLTVVQTLSKAESAYKIAARNCGAMSEAA